METYSKENEQGRRHAAQVIEDCRLTGNMVKLVREIRSAAAADDSESIGFIYALAEQATAGRV